MYRNIRHIGIKMALKRFVFEERWKFETLPQKVFVVASPRISLHVQIPGSFNKLVC